MVSVYPLICWEDNSTEQKTARRRLASDLLAPSQFIGRFNQLKCSTSRLSRIIFDIFLSNLVVPTIELCL